MVGLLRTLNLDFESPLQFYLTWSPRLVEPRLETCAHPRDLSVASGFRYQNMNTSAILAHRDGWALTRGFFGRITRPESWRCAGDPDLVFG